jgi:hypothetical protein
MKVSFIGGPCAGRNIYIANEKTLPMICTFPKGIMYIVQSLPRPASRNREEGHYVLKGKKYVHSSILTGHL